MITKSKQYFLPAILLLLLTIGLFLFTKQRQPTFPQALCKDCNVILITMTNLRYDHMSSNGYFRATTPNLDKLAKEGLVFDNAFAHSSWTLPEAISIYTSSYPYQHGVMNRHDGSTLSKNTTTLIDVLNRTGFVTAAFTGGFDYNSQFGLTDRFTTHDDKCASMSEGRLLGIKRLGPGAYGEFECTMQKAITWLRENKAQKFFLHVQGYDAHCPYSQRGGYIFDKDYTGNIDYTNCLWTVDRIELRMIDGKIYYQLHSSKTDIDKKVLIGERDIEHLLALYDESIVFADKEVGRLLNEIKKIGLWGNTIIVFTSEHGDIFGKHGRFTRGAQRGTFYDDILHIPLLIRHPYVRRSFRIRGFVEHVDLMPTLLDFLGVNSPALIEGKSLIPLIFSKKKEVHEYVFAGTEFKPPEVNPFFSKRTRMEAIKNRKWKLIQETNLDNDLNPQILELYNLEKDSIERNNVVNEYPEVVYNLKSRLDKWSKKHREK